MLNLFILSAAAGIVAVLIIAAMRPSTFRVERSTSIQAPVDRIYPLINDLRRFNTWNPYANKDPAMRTVYGGPESGTGASFDFDGNKDVGRGSVRIVDAANPERIAMMLDMSAPFECHNAIEFRLLPKGDTTQVTWSMQGDSPFFARVVGLFMNMDRMVGGDFDAGLAKLKTIAERT